MKQITHFFVGWKPDFNSFACYSLNEDDTRMTFNKCKPTVAKLKTTTVLT